MASEPTKNNARLEDNKNLRMIDLLVHKMFGSEKKARGDLSLGTDLSRNADRVLIHRNTGDNVIMCKRNTKTGQFERRPATPWRIFWRRHGVAAYVARPQKCDRAT
jgi:hypothetical protein